MASTYRWLSDAIRSRVLINILLIVVMAVAVSAAVLGPLLLRAVAQSAIQQSAAEAGVAGTSLAAVVDIDGDRVEPYQQAAGTVLTAASGAAPGLWRDPELWTESSQNLAWAKQTGSSVPEKAARVRIFDAACAGLAFSDGTCPSRDGQIALSADDARLAAVAVGSQVTLRPPSTTIGPGAPSADVTVVGLYDAARSALPGTGAPSSTATADADPIVMTFAQATAQQVPVQVFGRLDLLATLRVQDEGPIRASTAALSAAVQQQSRVVRIETPVLGLLDRIDGQVRSATLLVAVTEIQVLALAVFAMVVVLQRIAVARAAEWGIGRLRAVPRRRWYLSIFLEPTVALILGCLVGFAAGVGVARAAVTASLGAEVAVEPWRAPVIGSAVGVLLACLIALAAVSRPSLRRPLVELIQQRSERRELGIGGAVAQAAVLLMTAATLYQLLTGGVLASSGSQLGLLAPALIALTAAILAVRLAVTIVRRVTVRPPRTLAALVVGRQAARTPSSLNPAVMVAVGMALMVFASQLLLVSTRNQSLRAAAVVGGPTVLQVAPPTGADLLTLVRDADPSGRFAMAVEERAAASDTGVARIIAVDTTRLAVAAWSPAWAGTADLGALRASAAAPIEVRGRQMQITLSGVEVVPGVVSIAGTAPADPELIMTVLTGGRWQTVRFGTVSSGPTFRAALPCVQGCDVISLGVRSEAGAAYTAELTIDDITTDQQPASSSRAWLQNPGWKPRVGDLASPSPRAQAVPTPTQRGLHVKAFDLDGGNDALILPPTAVDPLPALIGPATAAVPFAGFSNAVSGRGLDGDPQLLQVVATAATLPRLLDDGVLVDLPTANRVSNPNEGGRSSMVWLSADAPAAIEDALRDAGVTVTGRQQVAEEAAYLDRQPATRAAAASLYLGVAASILTLIALVAARAADVRRRRPDWQSLRDGGLATTTVRRLALIEIGVPVLIGVLLGLGSGVLGFVLAAPRLPLVDLSTPGPPLDLTVAWVPVAALGLLVAVLVLAIAGGAASVETRTRRDGHR